MSGGYYCNCLVKNKNNWRVTQRNCNHSAFNGYHRTLSRYSAVKCVICCRTWRTAANYVNSLLDWRNDEFSVKPQTDAQWNSL